AKDSAIPEPAFQHGAGLYGSRRQTGRGRRHRPGIQGNSRRQARQRAGRQLLHEGRHRGSDGETQGLRPWAVSSMAETLKLEIVTPTAVAFSADVEMVTLYAVEGQIGILPRHVPMLTRCIPGELIVRQNGQDEVLAMGEGLVEVTADSVSI